MGGRTLVLFTSRIHMLQTARQIKDHISQKGLRILVQNEDGTFAALINQFSNSSNTILFGLETFWEGIDLRGEILTCLIIVKLPFRSPGDPYANANDRYCRQRNIDGFRSFTLPDAALHFKQGVGRLIRSEEDKGILIVLDGRLDKSWYGAYFKKSIPIHRHIKIKSENLTNILRQEIKEKSLNI
jgi:ATP-dependent DNA helicase DinG